MASATRKRRGSVRRRIVVIGAALLVIALVGAWFATRPGPAAATEYDIVMVSRSPQTQTVSLSGTISPQEQTNATFRVPGTIDSVPVKVGDQVGVGGVLATVDPRDLSDAVALADANAAAARAQLTTVLDTSSATQPQIDAARAQVRSAEASLTSARNRLADATLTSPIAGTVAQVGYKVGDQVAGTSSASSAAAAAGSALSGTSATTTSGIVIIATDAWKLSASVGTADLPALAHGQAAVITPTGTSTQVEGTVDTIGIVATQKTGSTATFPVTIAITQADATLFSGSSADAVVTVGTYADVLAIPDTAITSTDDRATVRLLRGENAVETEVQTGRRFGSQTEILSGLAEGDRIQVPRATTISQPTQPMYGPNGQFASPTAKPS